MWEQNLGTQAGVHLIEGVRLILGPLNTCGMKTQEGGGEQEGSFPPCTEHFLVRPRVKVSQSS